MKPTDVSPAWDPEPSIDRIQACELMLSTYEFLTVSESRKVRERIDKWAKLHGLVVSDNLRQMMGRSK